MKVQEETVVDTRRDTIHAAAVTEFSNRGYRSTSMANIAERAGMSRPALYQYFKNKGDIFASAFLALIEAHIDAALAALATPGPIEEQLDGFLQRFDGDLWEQMNASPFSEELMNAKSEALQRGMVVTVTRLHAGLRAHLDDLMNPEAADKHGQETSADDLVELLYLSPKGFKVDQPTIKVFRRRLTALARSVAAEVKAGAR